MIAVDGPSGAGKSSVSRAVASALGYRYLDTGAMYRALTWAVLRAGISLADPDAIAALAERTALRLETDPAQPRVAVDGVDVTAEIRGDAVTEAVSAVSAVPAVRTLMVARQRELIDNGGIVVEGRDIGKTVAPDAQVKIFLTAAAAARAERRSREQAADSAADVSATEDALRRRDSADSQRAASPLAQAPDAVVIDSTELGLDDVVRQVLARVAPVVAT
ncbi:MAG: (d)CMP kinase [Frankiales bacterium]|nr:(d)CMP kinase [Frankiales bacterium]